TRRALELAEQKARRRRLQDLTRRLRLASSDQPADQALAGALHRLDTSDTAMPADAIGTAADDAAERAELEGAEEPPPAEPPPPPPDPIALVVEGEAALDAGDQLSARRAYLAAATAFSAQGLIAA